MKQLTCEMCGGIELLKQDGVYVCQHCGTKYSVEEAKKMMNEKYVAAIEIHPDKFVVHYQKIELIKNAVVGFITKVGGELFSNSLIS